VLNVLITTSGLGNRLGNLTNYTNKSLVRLANKPAISYIIDAYPDNTNFIITIGYCGDYVKQFLSLAYPDKKITFIDIDKFEGEGSSLGYSIFKCKDALQKPFIFHACDTIVNNFEIVSPTEYNWVAGAAANNSGAYRTINVIGSNVIKINEKDELGYDYTYIGLCGIYDYKLFFSILEELLLANSNKTSLSDTHVINNMLNSSIAFKLIKTENWHDIGNTNELINTRKALKCDIKVLDKDDESIFFFKDTVIKFFSDKNICKNRILRGKSLSEENLTPVIIDSRDNFYKYKKANGIVFSDVASYITFNNFLEWAMLNLWKPVECDNFNDLCKNFYYNKTLLRVEQYLNKYNDDQHMLNGIQIPGVYQLLEKVNFDWLATGIPVQFHGDLILDNIIKTDKGFTLIDWRQDFSGNLLAGDIYYDLAKLYHNLTLNHHILDRKLFFLDNNTCEVYCSSRLIDCKKILTDFVCKKGLDFKKIEILSCIIWLNMAPLHAYPLDQFLFNFGKYNLQKMFHNL